MRRKRVGQPTEEQKLKSWKTKPMKIQKTPIEGLLIIQPTLFCDERGYFFESYNKKTLEKQGISTTFVQDNQSYSQKGVIRGLHFQKPPYAQAKLVRVVLGSIWDVAVDIRLGSPTYGTYFALELTAENQLQFLIPEGFAHGFSVLEDNTIVQYKCSRFYHKESEGTILFNDPTLAIPWNINNPIVAEKDLKGELFPSFISPFTL